MNKQTVSLTQAIQNSGLQSGMTISFHHHLRNGDYLLNMVLDSAAALGIRNLTVNASSILDVHAPLIEHIKNGVVTGLETNYMGSMVGREISKGVLEKPVIFRTHGSRAGDIIRGVSKIDVTFIAAPTSDAMGNCTGKVGKSAFGSLGYAISDAKFARHTIVVTDHLVPYPMPNFSISEIDVDQVVVVESIGNPSGIVSGTTKITQSPTRLKIAADALRVIEHSGLLQDGFAFQTGAGGISIAVASLLKEKMLKAGIQGSYCLGGITSYMVDLLQAGCFSSLMDVQCFDLGAVESMRNDPRHQEISAAHYADSQGKSCLVNGLSAVVLGATEIDLNFNVNVHTDSFGRIMGGSGGHSDAAQGAQLTIIVSPLLRDRIPVVRKRVTCISTPGQTVDVLVTEYGIAVNPCNPALRTTLQSTGVKLLEIEQLYHMAIELTDEPEPLCFRDKIAAIVQYCDGTVLDSVHCIL